MIEAGRKCCQPFRHKSKVLCDNCDWNLCWLNFVAYLLGQPEREIDRMIICCLFFSLLSIQHSIFHLSWHNSQIELFTTLIAYQNSPKILLHNIKSQIWFPFIDSSQHCIGGVEALSALPLFILNNLQLIHAPFEIWFMWPAARTSRWLSLSLSLSPFPPLLLLLKLSKLVSVVRVIYLRLNEIECRLNSPRPDNSHNFTHRQQTVPAILYVCMDLYIVYLARIVSY